MQNDRSQHINLCQAKEVLKELRPSLFEIFEFFAITVGIFAAISKIHMSGERSFERGQTFTFRDICNLNFLLSRY